MNRIPHLIAAALMGCSCLGFGQQPDKQPPSPPPPPPSHDGPKADAGKDAQPGADRDMWEQRLKRMLDEIERDKTGLAGALAKLRDNGSLDEVRALMPERLNWRARFEDSRSEGPDGSRRGIGGMGGSRTDQAFSEDDWKAVDAIITSAQPDMLEKFSQLRKQDPTLAQQRMIQAYPRIRPLLELSRHDRTGFELRLKEMEIARESLPHAKKIIQLRKDNVAEDSAQMKAALADMDGLARRQFQVRMQIERHEIERLKERVVRRQKEVDEQSADETRGIQRSAEWLIKQAERGDDGSPDKGMRREGGGGPGGSGGDGPRRRPTDG